jgi:hypothetical protein
MNASLSRVRESSNGFDFPFFALTARPAKNEQLRTKVHKQNETSTSPNNTKNPLTRSKRETSTPPPSPKMASNLQIPSAPQRPRKMHIPAQKSLAVPGSRLFPLRPWRLGEKPSKLPPNTHPFATLKNPHTLGAQS